MHHQVIRKMFLGGEDILLPRVGRKGRDPSEPKTTNIHRPNPLNQRLKIT